MPSKGFNISKSKGITIGGKGGFDYGLKSGSKHATKHNPSDGGWKNPHKGWKPKVVAHSTSRKKSGKWVHNDTRDYRFDPSRFTI